MGIICGKVAREWRELHKEELQNLCASPTINYYYFNEIQAGESM
jgi:hypothetical protein